MELHNLSYYSLLLLLLPLRIYSALECELYIAESTIPNAGIGIFVGSARSKDEAIGNGDKAIPLVDLYFHNGNFEGNYEANDPTVHYVWAGADMGMKMETMDENDITAFWPGIDAMVNCHPGLFNLDKATPVYDEGGIHRSKHSGAGAISPYNAKQSSVIRDIPVGGEVFKDYSPDWFIERPWLGNIPLEDDYEDILVLLSTMNELLDGDDVSPSMVYDGLLKDLQKIWDSRTLNAMYNFTWDDMLRAIDEADMGFLLQPNATRSIEWLDENGKCIDHIVNGRSTIDGAGSGAFAKRDLPKDTIVTGTPLLVFPNSDWFSMYDSQECPDGLMARNMTGGPYGQQLLLNYCFGHPQTSIILCPYGSGVNYINHNKTRANVRVQWARNGSTGHQDESLEKPLSNNTKVALDYVATRDIEKGEELFLDYGDIWEEQWKEAFELWRSDYHSSLTEYVSATVFNDQHGEEPLLTTEEQMLNPYPENLSTRCHWVVCESQRNFNNGMHASELSNWYAWNGDNSGCPCDILTRHEDDTYSVRVVPKEYISKRVANVPREAIKLMDNPYTTDLHMIGVFRQVLGIPDDILPDAWRNLKIQTSPHSTVTDPCSVTSDEEVVHVDGSDIEFEEYQYSRLPQSRVRGA